MKGLRWVVAVVRSLPARLAELVPSPGERCGTAPWRGGTRVLIGTARGVVARFRSADVVVGDGAHVAADLRTPHGRRLFAYGFCEPAASVMRSLLRPGDVVIDGGANIGLYTALAAARVGRLGHVIACEPSPTTMTMLRATADLNGYDWVELREVALAEVPGRLTMHVFQPGSGFSSFAPAVIRDSDTVEVEVTTLDDLAGTIDRPVNLVKLDLEGAELRALRGAQVLLREARPDFLIELEPQHLERQGCSVAELQELFDDVAYVGFAVGDIPERLSGAWERPHGDPNILVRPRERA